MTAHPGGRRLSATVAGLARSIAQVVLRTALVIVDALSTGPGSATSAVTHLPVVLPRPGGHQPPDAPPATKRRFRRKPRRFH